MAILLLISVGVHGYYRFDPKGYAYTQEFMDQGQAYRTLKEDNIRMLSKVNDPSVYRVHAEGYRYKNYGLINHLNTDKVRYAYRYKQRNDNWVALPTGENSIGLSEIRNPHHGISDFHGKSDGIR